MNDKPIGEFICQRKESIDEEIIQKDLHPADLHIQIWDNNLVILSFGIEKELGAFRLCWGNYLEFVDCIADWFFDEDDTIIGQSCIDEKISIQCTAHSDYTITMALSIDDGENYDIVFNTNRGQFLNAVDNAATMLERMMPDEHVCYEEPEPRVLH